MAGSRTLVDYLINRARSFIFSTAPVPAAAAAATAAIHFVKSKPGKKRRNLLWERVAQFNSKLKTQNSKLSAIIPLIIGGEIKALQAAADLRAGGFLIPAIRYPTVARGSARLRLTLTATHTAEEVEKLCGVIEDLKLLPH